MALEHQPDQVWNLGRTKLRRGSLPLLMGIVNVTPDSFSDGGRHNSVDDAVAHSLKLVDQGAEILDVGGESTRPGSQPVSRDEELRRTIPVIERLAQQTSVPISIDTTKAEVARQAIQAGAIIVNDISGMTFEPEMMEVCAEFGVGVCAMHIKGTPQTMQQQPTYEDVVGEVIDFLQQRAEQLVAAGVRPEAICLDPGIGFGKTAEHNLRLMRAIPQLRAQLQRPVLIGHSRKRFLSKVLGRTVEERLAGTIGVSVALDDLRADVLRVHDVGAVRDALVARRAVRGEQDE